MSTPTYEVVIEIDNQIKTFPTKSLDRALEEYNRVIISDEQFDQVALILPDRALVTERYKVVDE